jgi:hypothetical protein
VGTMLAWVPLCQELLGLKIKKMFEKIHFSQQKMQIQHNKTKQKKTRKTKQKQNKKQMDRAKHSGNEREMQISSKKHKRQTRQKKTKQKQKNNNKRYTFKIGKRGNERNGRGRSCERQVRSLKKYCRY